ncbi:transcriptional regulator, LacI family [Ancylobacter novellus DSM 506]|uniref:Transcriptional regulator, LacI family n=1 Tax=Ancylobacter novellus (strain ATCC 8093 / DSM 506 / JCM 20403 / CCM 1077 / IAM 12100 / NBRC 12443 / NCIMB 10456) TaxID=639283 RepID=D7AA48_ANCN5|nr:LacI family DNA-binding transcriptional regulator [Ancylobacter novellus]ADH90835.1 transcriptional regulator, LacI family [Ancylobacter novellus DSM 506]
MQHQRPKIVDVARLAGVSTATVSRVLSNPEIVSAETRRLVEEAIRQTGYRLNQAARNLRIRRTGGVLALVPNLSNPFFSQILAGMAAVLAPAGYNLLVADTRAEGGRSILTYAEPSRADGLIVLDGTLPAEGFAGRLPLVLACEWIPGIAAPRVKIDNREAAMMAVEHLIGLGHRSVAHVAGPRGNVLSEARLAGTEQALAAHGLPAPMVFPGDFSLESGRRAGAAWLALPPHERPTAVFLASDAMACGFIGEVQHHDVMVPRDVSVMGFDDIELVSHMTPALSTIRQPREALGRRAAQRLLDRIGGDDRADDTILPVELVLRGSTAPPGG